MPVPLLLTLDTATKSSSIALTRGYFVRWRGCRKPGSVFKCFPFKASYRAVSTIFFQETGLTWKEIDAIAVGLGPGSFTGLRSRHGDGKGVCLRPGVCRCWASPVLPEWRHAVCPRKTVWAVLDARKKQVYAGKYRCRAGEIPALEGNIRAVDPMQLASEIDEEVVMVGDGVHSYGDLWRKELGAKVEFVPDHMQRVSAPATGLICGEFYLAGNHLDPATAAPHYVRASDAELSLAEKKKGQANP